MRILVTAIGGDIGYGIGKILRMAEVADFLLGCDVHAEHAGRLYFDRCEIVVRAASEGYIDNLCRLVREHRIDLVIPASEAELRYLLTRGLDSLDGVPLLAANPLAMRIGFDKLQTADSESTGDCRPAFPMDSARARQLATVVAVHY
jgi:carbamoyl-phosphate synthase large subunit